MATAKRSQKTEKSSFSRPAPATARDLREHASAAAGWLRALANEHRLLVMCALCEAGELSVGRLNERVPLSQSALSQHLSILRRDGLVVTRREAQTIFYSLADGTATRVIELLHDRFCPGGVA